MQGAGNGLSVMVGRAATNFIASKVPIGQTSTVGQAVTKVLAALVTAKVVKVVTRSERAAAFALAGGFEAVLQPVVAGIPTIGPMLSGVGVYPRPANVGVYPRAALAGMGRFPNMPSAMIASGTFGRSDADQLGTDTELLGATASVAMV